GAARRGEGDLRLDRVHRRVRRRHGWRWFRSGFAACTCATSCETSVSTAALWCGALSAARAPGAAVRAGAARSVRGVAASPGRVGGLVLVAGVRLALLRPRVLALLEAAHRASSPESTSIRRGACPCSSPALYGHRLTPRPPVNKWLVTISVTFGTLMGAIDASIVNVAVPHIRGAVGATVQEITWISTGFSLAMVLVMPLTAFLGRLFGQKRLYLFCLAL